MPRILQSSSCSVGMLFQPSSLKVCLTQSSHSLKEYIVNYPYYFQANLRNLYLLVSVIFNNCYARISQNPGIVFEGFQSHQFYRLITVVLFGALVGLALRKFRLKLRKSVATQPISTHVHFAEDTDDSSTVTPLDSQGNSARSGHVEVTGPALIPKADIKPSDSNSNAANNAAAHVENPKIVSIQETQKVAQSNAQRTNSPQQVYKVGIKMPNLGGSPKPNPPRPNNAAAQPNGQHHSHHHHHNSGNHAPAVAVPPQTPPRIPNGRHTSHEESKEVENTPHTSLSTLTPDTGFHDLLAHNGYQSDAESTISEGTGIHSEADSTVMRTMLQFDDKNTSFEEILRRSEKIPNILVGWKIYVQRYGTGVILSMKKKFGRTTKFVIQFENGQVYSLKLQRSYAKGNVPFTLIKKVA